MPEKLFDIWIHGWLALSIFLIIIRLYRNPQIHMGNIFAHNLMIALWPISFPAMIIIGFTKYNPQRRKVKYDRTLH